MRAWLLTLAIVGTLTGCTPIQGERFWWDDQKQAKLATDFTMPDWPPETPLTPDEKIFVDKQYRADEPERAKKEELGQVAAGIPRAGIPDPYADPQHLPVAQWSGEPESLAAADNSADNADVEK
ncbi:hypothetical protein FACS1894139_01940 [Planctomycetales bacterium]|nr:hypothetical protein FACS1894107_10680 [Planctomycetales bacterium]GHS96805.1 hypothetical protein FACS1894108_02060 [Planctomycetales bacterium]GHT02880.1 hypothetical protein FACS1894139_01940 [Planctomycetales bacterium]GHV23808.1 hypothetical protein AGMMS49959_18170 [Planctomycetales bacterium]